MLIETGIVIDGTDISSLIEKGGIDWERIRIEGNAGGTMLSGRRKHDILATKSILRISCQPMSLTALRMLANLLAPDELTVVYDDPQLGTVSMSMWSENPKAKNRYVRSGREYWDHVTFTLEEL